MASRRLVGPKLDPSHSREAALRYFKVILKFQILSEDVTEEQFTSELLKHESLTCSAFQQLIFSEHGICKTSADIEKAVCRFIGLFVEAGIIVDQSSILTKPLLLPKATTSEDEDLFCISEYISHALKPLVAEFYKYISRHTTKRMSMIKTMKLLKKKYALELAWMNNLEKRCKKVFGGKQTLTADEFHRVIEYQKELSDKIFKKFDRSQTGTLDVNELYDGLVGIITSNTAGRLKYLFDIYDKDGNGTLNREEVKDVLSMCISESRLQLHENLVEELTNIVWGKITKNEKDHITFDEFYSTLRSYPSVYENLSVNVIGSGDFCQMFRFLEKRKKVNSVFEPLKQQVCRIGARFRLNKSLWLIIILYLATTAALLGERIYYLVPRPFIECWYVAAKCAGQLLNFNISFALLLTLKHSTTKLRRFATLRRIIPFDDLHFLHKMVAYFVVGFGIVHCVAHGSQIGVKLSMMDNISKTYFMDDNASVIFWTGVAMLFVLLVLVIGSLPKVRHISFELFLRTHQICAVLFVVMMVFHGKHFWKWCLLPAVLIIGERVYFLVMLIMNRTKIEVAAVHGNITQLTIKTPHYFKYSPGDYVNINIPELSKSQYHPFTISSSPDSVTDSFTLHIRKVGNWTGRLHRAVSEEARKQRSDNLAYLEERDLPPIYQTDSDFSCASTPSLSHKSHDDVVLDMEKIDVNDLNRNNNNDFTIQIGADSSSSDSDYSEAEDTSSENPTICIVPQEPATEGNAKSEMPDEHVSHKACDTPSEGNHSDISITIEEDSSSCSSKEAENGNFSEAETMPPSSPAVSSSRPLSLEISVSEVGSSRQPSPLPVVQEGILYEECDASVESDEDTVQPSASTLRSQKVHHLNYQRHSSASTHSLNIKAAPCEKKIIRSTESLDNILESRRATLLNFMKRSSSSSLPRDAARSSIVPIPVEEVALLNWRVYLDGPYSTPSRDILKTKHAILVAGGIGITPFASVLESVMSLLKDRAGNANRICCCTSKGSNRNNFCRKRSALEKIDFFWITRDQSHLSWFHTVFREIEETQAKLGMDPPLVNLHIYLTGLKRSEDIRGAFLQLALEMIYQEDDLDVLSGLKAKTKPGRPDWKTVLPEITKRDKKEKRSRPKLYACGPPMLCDDLKHECYKLDITFKEEVF